MSFDKDYIDAWNSLDEDRFVGLFASDGCYSDATMCLSYVGESEIRRMFRGTMAYYADPQFIYVSGFSDERHYVVEWISITKVDGKEYKTRVASVGDLDDQGRIIENRDYFGIPVGPERRRRHVCRGLGVRDAFGRRRLSWPGGITAEVLPSTACTNVAREGAGRLEPAHLGPSPKAN